MKEECSGMYYNDGAIYLIKKMCDTEESKRPLHCTDPSRRSYIVKSKNKWQKDFGCKKIKEKILPIIDNLYRKFYEIEFGKSNEPNKSYNLLQQIRNYII